MGKGANGKAIQSAFRLSSETGLTLKNLNIIKEYDATSFFTRINVLGKPDPKKIEQKKNCASLTPVKPHIELKALSVDFIADLMYLYIGLIASAFLVLAVELLHKQWH